MFFFVLFYVVFDFMNRVNGTIVLLHTNHIYDWPISNICAEGSTRGKNRNPHLFSVFLLFGIRF